MNEKTLRRKKYVLKALSRDKLTPTFIFFLGPVKRQRKQFSKKINLKKYNNSKLKAGKSFNFSFVVQCRSRVIMGKSSEVINIFFLCFFIKIKNFFKLEGVFLSLEK